MDNCTDLRATVNKNKQKKKKSFKTYQQRTKFYNCKKIQKFVKNKKRRKTGKELQRFQGMIKRINGQLSQGSLILLL